MGDIGGLPKLNAHCGQCGQRYSAPACGPTHALVWNAIEAPMKEEREYCARICDALEQDWLNKTGKKSENAPIEANAARLCAHRIRDNFRAAKAARERIAARSVR